VGLEQVGKTTLFRILTRARGSDLKSGKPAARVGVAPVPDPRLDHLAGMFHPRKTTHASLEFVDEPGSVIDLARSGIHAADLRELDALAQVMGAFGDEPASLGSTTSVIQNVELELILSDLGVVEKRLERVEKDMKKQKNPALEKEHHVLQVSKQALENQTPLREVPLGSEEERAIRGFAFLSQKPTLYVLNHGEKDAARVNAPEVFLAASGLKGRRQTGITAICGKVEAELTELSDQEATEFLASYGLKDSALDRVVRSAYQLLELISFYTVAGDECRAWPIRSGTTAFEAAGEVHTDFQKGFIRAEVVNFADLASAWSLAESRNQGHLKLEGKDYVLRDGEVLYFRHSA